MSTLSRRQFLTGLAAAPVALAGGLPMFPENGNISEVKKNKLSELAWQRIAPEQQNEWYKNQLWKTYDATAEIDRRRAATLRWRLSEAHCFPLVCYDLHPIVAARRTITEANRRAALVTIIEGLSGPDLTCLFEVAALLDEFPMDAGERAALGERQRLKFEPGYALSKQPAEEPESVVLPRWVEHLEGQLKVARFRMLELEGGSA